MDKIEEQKELWRKRAQRYNNLEWVKKSNVLQAFMLVGNFDKDHVVLDAGCGTGKVLGTVAPYVKEVHGVDISEEMLSQIDLSSIPNAKVSVGDIGNLDYPDNFFDRITVRLVLHHILDDDDLMRVLKELYRVLKPNGKIIVSEGVPPHEDVKKDYEEVFKLKEKRRVFMPEDLVRLLKRAGFRHIRVNIIIDEHMSVRNWLENAGDLDEETIEKIYNMHKFASPRFKEVYNLVDKGDDILIDVKVALVTGIK